MKTTKALPIDLFLGMGVELLPLHERISARRAVEWIPGDKKFCTKEELGMANTEMRQFYANQKKEPLTMPNWMI